MLVKMIFWFGANALAIAAVVAVHRWVHRKPAEPKPGEPASREDMLFIWTEVHGIPREKAESMWEEYQRASAVSSLGLKGK